MSILTHKDDQVLIQGGPAGVNAARCMAEFRYLIGEPVNVPAFVYPPDAGKTVEVPYGTQYVSTPVYGTVTEAVKMHPEINTSLVYVGADRAGDAAVDALDAPNIRLVSMITESLPEKDARLLLKKARDTGKIFNGPSSIGILSGGESRLGVVGGNYENLVLGELYKSGSFGIVTKSGGMLNEIMWIVSMHGDGVSTAVGLGGDSFPGMTFVDCLELFEKDQGTHAVIMVGETGGTLEEEAACWYASEPRRIKIIGMVSGFCQEVLPKGMKFGHAGAKAGPKGEGAAEDKRKAFEHAGFLVPESFNEMGRMIADIHKDLINSGKVKVKKRRSAEKVRPLPKTVGQAVSDGDVLAEHMITSTICDERGEEPLYSGYPASELAAKGYQMEHVVGLLWLGRLLTSQEAAVVRRILILTADHGPCVSGALTTIIASSAGIPLAQSVAAGLLMIGPRFGGAVTDASKYFKYGVDENMEVEEFLAHMKEHVGPVPGIGHRVKSLSNPDKRVQSLLECVREQGFPTPVLDFALAVEKRTTRKKENLILNVDGAMGAVLTDMGFPPEALNGFFVLARTIGFTGHWLDQKRQGSRLIRMFKWLVRYATPGRRTVPPLESL
ncbi:MAG: citrate/2-methylcitrate synthase [bacterium]|nr:citrate/2-methylcitrate synthase [bacterium]MDT8365826.1 citrate/2-methylcitrate synthase [bacterium]